MPNAPAEVFTSNKRLKSSRFIPHQTQHYATSSYMLYIYINILEQCKAIMHLCNMLREVKQKYKKQKKKKIGVFDDYNSGENEKC